MTDLPTFTRGRLSPLFAPRGRAATLLDLALVTAVFVAVCGPFLGLALSTAIPGGWDGVPHYAIAAVYARDGFPAVTGWMPEYYAGMPYPNFYPPVFYMVVAALTKVGLSLRGAFLGVQAASALAVPLLTYALGRRLSRSRIGGLVAGAIAAGLMVDHNPLWRMGITLPSTFDAGLSTQLLGHVFLLAFLLTLLGAEERPREAIACSALFALVPLTNVHMVWVAAFLFLPHAAASLIAAPDAKVRRERLILYSRIGAIGFLLAAVWAIPMVANLAYVPTQALPPPPPGVVAFTFLRFGAYWGLALLAAFAKRDGRALGLGLGLLWLLAFTVLPSARWLALEHLAIQPARVVIPFPFLVAPLVGYLVSAIGDLSKHAAARALVGAAAAVLFFRSFHLTRAPEALVTAAEAAEYENALGPLSGRTDGRVLVEMGAGGMSDGFAMQGLAGMRGRSVTTVFRESAIDVLFAVPLRNMFSAQVEAFGVDHKLNSEELVRAPVDAQERLLDLFNVRYFAVQSDLARARIGRLRGVTRLSPPGRWELWGREEAPGYAAVPAFAPFLTFTAFSVKPRPDDGLDFVRLGEEMFAAGRIDVPLAHAPCKTLDACPDLDRFEGLLLVDYPCSDCGRAREDVVRFAERGRVVLVDSEAPLHRELRAALEGHPHVRVVGRTRPGAPEPEPMRAAARETARWILDAVDALRIPLAGAPRVTSARLDGERAEIALDRAPERPLPVWIRQGFFPSWESDAGSPVYLATPTFQLTFTGRKELTLRFGTTASDLLGRALGIFGLCALGAWIAALARRGRAGPPPGRGAVPPPAGKGSNEVYK